MATAAMSPILKTILPVLGGVAGFMPQTGNTSGSSATTGSSQQSTVTHDDLAAFLNSLTQGTTSGSTTGTSTTNPNLSPGHQALIDQLLQRYKSITTPSLSGYQAQQIGNINNTSNIQSQAVQNLMASRGLATSPVSGAAGAEIEQNRLNQITQLNQGLPLLQHQLDLGNLQAASNFQSSIPHGTTTTSSGTSLVDQLSKVLQNSGSTNSSVANTSGTSQQNTNQQQNTSAGGGIGGLAGGLGAVLASLFSDERLKEDIRPINKAVDKLMVLRPVSWKWKNSEVEDQGLLAQDLLKVLPELVHKDPEGSGFLKVNYAGLISTLVGAVQELAEAQ